MKNLIFNTTFILFSLCSSIVYFSSCNPDPCKTRAVECKNNGVCKDGDCICEAGYEGDSCQFPVNKKFDSYYACIRTRITNGTLIEDNDDTLHVKALADKFAIQFFSIRDSAYEVLNGVVNENYIDIPKQNRDFPLLKHTVQYSGNGSLNNGVLTITLFKSWTDTLLNHFDSKTTYVGYKY